MVGILRLALYNLIHFTRVSLQGRQFHNWGQLVCIGGSDRCESVCIIDAAVSK